MTRCCPTCGGTGTVAGMAPDDLAARVAGIRAACALTGAHVTADERVDEASAAAMLGLKAKTLSNWRHAHRPLAYVKRNGRVLYSLAELARWMAENERDPEN